MENQEKVKEKAIGYLLGELNRVDREDFEERIFVDEQIGYLVSDVENDLIDEYVRGELEFNQKRAFERSYLSNECRSEKVAIARLFNRELVTAQSATVISTEEIAGVRKSLTSFFRFPNLALGGGVASIVLLLLVGSIWFSGLPGNSEELVSVENSENRERTIDSKTPVREKSPQIGQEPVKESGKSVTEVPIAVETRSSKVKSKAASRRRAAKEKRKRKNLSVRRQLKKKQTKITKKRRTIRRAPVILTFSLFPALRSSKNPVFNIPDSAKSIRLRIFDNYGRTYKKFLVELNNAQGITIWSKEVSVSTRRSQKSISVTIGNQKLRSGNYEVSVSGITKPGKVEEINFYNFVVRKDQEIRE